jgi:hypothetical protein
MLNLENFAKNAIHLLLNVKVQKILINWTRGY